MGSSVGRLALGVVGALIAPVGFAAIGFSIGSAIGGMLFAPEGPTVKGPRLKDTAVTASTLGKPIEFHMGRVRTGGNIIWSAGLKEKKKKKSSGGGGKGSGGGSTQITFSYSASFAVSFGHAPGTIIHKIWGDGKLIYENGGRQRKGVNFRFIRGGRDTNVDPLIAESINRRLAGFDDVNAGNQKQKKFKNLTQIISDLEADGTDRAALYADRLQTLKDEAEALADGGIPDYRFTPAYKDFCYIVFDDMPLKDFANRIPNITAEIEFDVADQKDRPDQANLSDVSTISSGVPTGGLDGVNIDDQFVVTDTAGRLRRFSAFSLAESRSLEVDDNILRILASNAAGECLAIGETDAGEPALIFLSPGTMAPFKYITTSMWPGLDRSDNPTDSIRAQRFPIKRYDEDDPAGSEALGFIVMTDTDMCIVASAPPSQAASLDDPDGDIESVTLPIFGPRGDSESPGGFQFGQPESEQAVSGGDGTRDFAFTPIWGQINEAESEDATPAQIATAQPLRGLVLFSGTHASDSDVDRIGVLGKPYRAGSETPRIWYSMFGDDHVRLFIADITNDETVINIFDDGEENGFFNRSPTITSEVSLESRGRGKVDFSSHPNVTDVSFMEYDFETLDNGKGGDAPWRFMTRHAGGVGRLKNKDEPIEAIPLPPKASSGFSRSQPLSGELVYGNGTDAVLLNVNSGDFTVFPSAFTTGASTENQLYVTLNRALFTWDGDNPVLCFIGPEGSLLGGSQNLNTVVEYMCREAGMELDEYDVSQVPPEFVHGFTIGSRSTVRQVMDIMVGTYFLDAIEQDWKIVFKGRDNTVVRTIQEDELGTVGDSGQQSNYVHTRTPEYDLPREMTITYPDQDRDYDTNTSEMRRASAPISTMDTIKVENRDLPIVLKPADARALAEKLLFHRWMTRDAGKAILPWAHLDLDPGDVVELAFNDGTRLTERIERSVIGANFEMEVETTRAADPVQVARPAPQVNFGGVGQQEVATIVPSETFVFDIPAIADFQSSFGAETAVYLAAGSQNAEWQSASMFRAYENDTFESIETLGVQITWGTVVNRVYAPRAYWTTDTDNYLRVQFAYEDDDINSVTYAEMLSGSNRALLWNPARREGEIIAFQDAEMQDDGSFVLTNLLRGLRGTEYFCDQHTGATQFFLLDQTALVQSTMDLGRVGQNVRYKAVSPNQLISEVVSHQARLRARNMMPWAPSRVRRSVETPGGVRLRWNRRTRVGGQWNTTATTEVTPFVEATELYKLWILSDTPDAFQRFSPNDPGTFLAYHLVSEDTFVLTAARLTAMGLTQDDPFRVILLQSGAAVDGFPGRHVLAP